MVAHEQRAQNAGTLRIHQRRLHLTRGELDAFQVMRDHTIWSNNHGANRMRKITRLRVVDRRESDSLRKLIELGLVRR